MESWLSGGKPSGVVLRDHADETPKLSKDTDVLMFVELQRRRVRELRADLHCIESSPFPSAYCKQRLRDQITTLAERGRPSVSRLVEHDGNVDFANEHRSVPIIAGSKEAPVTAICAWQQSDALALFAWLHRDELLKRLDEEIDAEADDDSALSHADRERRAAEVQADLLATERTECAAVLMAWSQNLPVEFRPTPIRSRCSTWCLSSRSQRNHPGRALNMLSTLSGCCGGEHEPRTRRYAARCAIRAGTFVPVDVPARLFDDQKPRLCGRCPHLDVNPANSVIFSMFPRWQTFGQSAQERARCATRAPSSSTKPVDLFASSTPTQSSKRVD